MTGEWVCKKSSWWQYRLEGQKRPYYYSDTSVFGMSSTFD